MLCWEAGRLSGTDGSGQKDTGTSKRKVLGKEWKEIKKGEVEPTGQNHGSCLIWVAGMGGSFYYSFSYFH